MPEAGSVRFLGNLSLVRRELPRHAMELQPGALFVFQLCEARSWLECVALQVDRRIHSPCRRERGKNGVGGILRVDGLVSISINMGQEVFTSGASRGGKRGHETGGWRRAPQFPPDVLYANLIGLRPSGKDSFH